MEVSENVRLPQAITPVQQFSYTQGKNSSDAALIIDAMDLLYSKNFDAFALITSDSDFTKLASRLKESQIFVFGVGESKTPIAFRNACDDFILTEVLRMPEEEKEALPLNPANTPNGKKSRQELRMDTKLVNILRNAAAQYADEDGWAPLGPCGGLIKRQYPDFDPRNYGYQSLTKLMEATELFEIDRRKLGSETVHHIYVKNRRMKIAA